MSMPAKALQYPTWFVGGVTPGPCPISNGLMCDIPITRLLVVTDGQPCHQNNCCRGHNHPDAVISTQAQQELNWRTAH